MGVPKSNENSQKQQERSVFYKILEIVSYGHCGTVIKFNSGLYDIAMKIRSDNEELCSIEYGNVSEYCDFGNLCMESEIYRFVGRHKNIVKYISTVYYDKTNFGIEVSLTPKIGLKTGIVMEYIPKTLEMFMVEHGDTHIEPNIIKSFMFDILNGLKHLFMMNVIHNDITPENILINSDMCLKICDFGSANVNVDCKFISDVSNVCYQSPEDILNIRRNPYCADMWSAGCIFYNLLTSKKFIPENNFNTVEEQLSYIFGKFPDESFDCYSGNKTFKSVPDYFWRNNKRKDFLYDIELEDSVAKDLLLKMLNPDELKRIMVYDALDHEYFNKY
jgi:serine/threonine protein kinase